MIDGKMSYFGGPQDTGVKPAEGLALLNLGGELSAHCLDVTDPRFSSLFLPEQPPNTTGTARRLNPMAFYLAYRWRPEDREYLRNHRLIVRNPRTGKFASAQVVDWGPAEWTGRIADLSPGLCRFLDLDTDDTVELHGLPGEAPFEPVGTKRADLGQPATPQPTGRTDVFDDLYKEFQQAVDAQLLLAKEGARSYVKGGWLKIKAIAHDSAHQAELAGKEKTGPDKLKHALELGEAELEQHIDWGKAPFILRSALREAFHFALETLIERTVALSQFVFGKDWGTTLDEQIQKIEWTLEEKLGTDLGGDGVVGQPKGSAPVNITVNQK